MSLGYHRYLIYLPAQPMSRATRAMSAGPMRSTSLLRNCPATMRGSAHALQGCASHEKWAYRPGVGSA